MRILKTGIKAKDWHGRVTCRRCGAELEVTREDLNISTYGYAVSCPQCGGTVPIIPQPSDQRRVAAVERGEGENDG